MSKQIATRLTCFALISAIEQDLRDHLLRRASAGVSTVLPADQFGKAQRRLLDAGKFEVNDPSTLLSYCDFADLAVALRQLHKAGFGSGPEVDIANAIEQASPMRNRVCHSRPLEPEDFPALLDLVVLLNQEQDALALNHLHDTQERLSTDPGSVFSLEIPDYWQDRTAKPVHNLPVAEFDDTGFLGRHRDRESLTRLIKSPHPVITVVGEGGVGKTALALRCLYDLVGEADRNPFDAIVWVSLKTTALTFGGTKEVRDSVVNAMGLLRRTSEELGVPLAQSANAQELLKEILDYMAAFKILLAIDNLETLTMGDLRDLLVDLPLGSKVLLTSRVPLGEFEVRYTLDRMDDVTAMLLARRYANLLNVSLIAAAPEPQLKAYVDALFGNPLLIKWFVGAVSGGVDPERLLSTQPGEFDNAVAFCFQNLYDRLTDTERQVLLTIAAARKPLTRGELILLLKRSVPTVEEALSRLSNSSMVRRPTRTGEAFCLTSIAAAYIARLRPPDAELVQQVTRDIARVRRLGQIDPVRRAGYEYDPLAFEWKNKDELIATSMLRVAQEAARETEYDAA